MSSQPTVNGLNGSHYKEINQHYAEECSQDDIGTFLFTSESVGEGHPGRHFDQSKHVHAISPITSVLSTN